MASGTSDEVDLASVPSRVYKVNDGIWSKGPTESWFHWIKVIAKNGNAPVPTTAAVDIFSGQNVVKTVKFSKEALNAARRNSFNQFAEQKEAYDLSHFFREPVALGIDKVLYGLELSTPQGQTVEESVEVPINVYDQKAKLVFPMEGAFVVVNGWVTDGGHKEWSQHFAYDIVALGEHYEMLKGQGKSVEDFVGWGREIVAPAEGLVTYARNDVPDQPELDTIDREILANLPDPMWAAGGNCVTIGHGNGEFSFLAHLQKGTVAVKIGDHVRQGQLLGLLGNSGNSTGPHLHYHLMDGDRIFRSNGLPSRFENVEIASPKRGIFLEMSSSR